MRIRPAFVTAAGTCIAFSAVAVVVFASTPQEAQLGLIRLLWIAIFLSIWGAVATVLLLVRQSMAQAIWVGLWPALAGVGILLAQQRGMMSRQLLLGTVLATLVISVVIWWKLHRMRN